MALCHISHIPDKTTNSESKPKKIPGKPRVREVLQNNCSTPFEKVEVKKSEKSEAPVRLKPRYWPCFWEMMRSCKDGRRAPDGVWERSTRQCGSYSREQLHYDRIAESCSEEHTSKHWGVQRACSLVPTLNSCRKNNYVCSIFMYVCRNVCIYMCVCMCTDIQALSIKYPAM